MRPQLAGLARKHGDKVVVLKVNVDRQRTLAAMAGVRSIPDRRLYFAGRQLERSVGATHLESLERIVAKHEGMLDTPGPAVAQRTLIPMNGLRKLELQVQEVRSGNGMPAVHRSVSKPETGAPAAPGPEAAARSGAVEPMAPDWLPPGVTRVE